ncbi:hypothetical protein U8326_13015 [Tsuneonella sp. CC-YZS046]|uniref:hypothetical protein n=1 Tax=Tsuneonella sp. CC-YZS046 TaxID=3042152 RepID=UPI002D7991F4|nr:hypothetical protein [Tsuneonella sp. CC-YZS046]WRO65953.1 hypothetical protein U8326_13015 [Tsuneonella sp. CC-YZS046]
MRIVSCIPFAMGASLLLTGCIARTAVDVVTLPVKAVGGAVDATTTSQSEADEKRGRALRKQEERLGKLERQHRKAEQACHGGNDAACREMAQLEDEMEALRRSGY